MEKQLIKNLFMSNDSVEILDFMIDNNIMPKDFSRSRSISHSIGKDFYLIIFLPDEKEQKFLKFEFIDFARCLDSLMYLSYLLKQYSNEDYNTFKPAQRKVDEMIYMYPTYRALFKYKDSDEEALEKELY